MMSLPRILAISPIALLMTSIHLIAQIDYPFEVPAHPQAELDVNTSIREPINSMNLDLNYGPDHFFGFNNDRVKEQVRRFNPSSTRFPIGVWANWYNWETDSWDTDTSTYSAEYDDIITRWPNKQYGFDGLKELHDELNFDVLFSFNLLYDSPEKGARRFNDRLTKGFDLKWIELGNEIFWRGQRSGNVDTIAKYVDVAKAHSQALKTEDPFTQLAVPSSWRTTGHHVGWNDGLASDQSFYDAVTVHKYIRHPSNPSESEIKEIMKAGKVLKDTADRIASLFPGKPQWYTEWGVSCGNNALSVLGMSDYFLTCFSNQNLIAMNAYHQVNGMDRFLTEDNQKTAFGAAYDIIRNVFHSSELYTGTTTATMLDQDTPVVQSVAVNKNGEIVVYAQNRTPNDIPFTIKFDGETYIGLADHKTYAMGELNSFPQFEIEENPLIDHDLQTASIVLPPFSINVISGFDTEEQVVSTFFKEAESAEGQVLFHPFESGFELSGKTYIAMIPDLPTTLDENGELVREYGYASYDFEVSEAGNVSLEVLGKFILGGNSFWHRIDGGDWAWHDNLENGSWKWVKLLKDEPLSEGNHTLQIAALIQSAIKLDRFRFTSNNGRLANPHTPIVSNLAVTRIEAEDYDEGGEGVGYHDRTMGNDGGVYRNDHVDIQKCNDDGGGYQVYSEQVGEWLQYTIHVADAGVYQLKTRAARSAADSSSFRIIIGNKNATGLLSIPPTESLNSFVDIVQEVELPAGKQTLQLKLTGGNVAINYIELSPSPINTP